ncbi:hypothetical protein MNBD_GAMMA13-1855 [hydrothermal vent metagenome]|uniref:Lipid A biosynthesis lauroyl acyltransferase n=1 Tax=hydrothermal vent metagenome TaxID=652676 RepID=A0A3B0YWT8_9ZZZZ
MSPGSNNLSDASHSSSTRTQVLRSPILHLGEVTVTERINPGKTGKLSGTRLKAFVFPLLHRLIQFLPVGVALLPARLLVAVAYLLYSLPNNPLRKACQDISLLSQDHSPRQLYRQYLRNILGVLDNFFTLYRHGSEAVLPRIHMHTDDVDRIQSLICAHGGVVLAVPHNIASAFSALRIGHCFDMLLVAKNSPTIERTRIALDFYERMQLSLLLVRKGRPIELSRAMFSCLRSGKLVAATLDNIDRTPQQIPTLLFGQSIGFSDWAARIAARTQVPVIPAYFHSQGKTIKVTVGSSLVCSDIPRAVQHYANFFEQEILKDPASWAYLADKHWQKVLHKAVGKQPVI